MACDFILHESSSEWDFMNSFPVCAVEIVDGVHGGWNALDIRFYKVAWIIYTELREDIITKGSLSRQEFKPLDNNHVGQYIRDYKYKSLTLTKL